MCRVPSISGTTNGRLVEADAYFFASTSSQRVAALETLLRRCYRNLVDGRKDYAGMSEDALSNVICNMLSMVGVIANHDVKRGGHVDITVEDPESGFLWIAEAKIHRGNAWTDHGFLQLTKRYGRSIPERDHAEILIYHLGGQTPSAIILGNWRDFIVDNYKNVEITHDVVMTELYFRTVHNCPASGLPYKVRHVIVPMTHDPLY